MRACLRSSASALRRWTRPVLAVGFCAGLLLPVGCEEPPPSKPRPRLSDHENGVDPAESMATIIDELSVILEQHEPDPAAAIVAVREYLLQRRADIDAAVRAAEQRALSLSGEARTEYLERTDPVLREAMGRFARAQQRFRAAANDAQKVELSEVLNSLR